MKSLKIYSQIVTNSHEEIEVYKRLLSLCGIKFEETSPLTMHQNNIKLRDVHMIARMFNVLHNNVSNFFDITVEEFVAQYPRSIVKKWRNVGKDSVSKLSKELGILGYAW
jgi:hypothetical protein